MTAVQAPESEPIEAPSIVVDADPAEVETDRARPEVDPDTYVGAVEVYLDAADWLTLADAPFKIHARKLAVSLDKQLAAKGEVQSALASTFAKVLGDLDKRRPGPPPAPKPDPLVDGVGPHGEASIFGLGMD